MIKTPIDAISQTLADANNWFVKLLELEPTFYQGDAPVGKKYGFSMPREINPGDIEVRDGYQTYEWTVDVLAEFIIGADANIQAETANCLLLVANAISGVNDKIIPLSGAQTGNFTAGRLSSTQSQQLREPHLWQVTIVGNATAQTYIYRDRCGRFVINC